jgi:alpha-1,2-mannosyltransferase
LAAFVEFRKRYPKESSNVKFVLIGGTRVDQPKDQAIVDSLKAEIHRLGLEDVVTVKTNIASSELRQWLSKARAGIHTMANEHFGISVVELMAAGVIPVVHDSGGPRKDIVVPWDNVETGSYKPNRSPPSIGILTSSQKKMNRL